MKKPISLVAALVAYVVANPILLSSEYALKETHPVPPAFTRESDAPKDHLLRLSVGLKQSRFDELERQLMEVSDPDHSRYGQHLSADDVHALVKPTDESLDLVHAWLEEHGIHQDAIDYSPARDFLTFTLPVERVERLLDTTYSVFRHTDGSSLVRTPQWGLPLHLHNHIETIQPTNAFIRTSPVAKLINPIPEAEVAALKATDFEALEGSSVASACNIGSISPLCLRTLYGTVGYKPTAGSKNQVALCDYLGEINNRSDTKLYLEYFRPGAVTAAQSFKQISVAGGTLQQTPETPKQLAAFIGLEGNLDVQTLLGTTYPVPLTAYSTKGRAPFIPDSLETTSDNEPYLTWLHYIQKQSDVPQVISNSYEDDEQTVPESYAKSVCAGFAQLGARGVSIIFGSGDGGVEGVQTGGECLNNHNNKTAFIPLFPSSCPYVTSVGATVGFSPERVAYDPRNGFVSGGGFSNYFKAPSYQSTAVASYLEKFGDKYHQYFNKSGRAYPDLAAYGVNYTIWWNGNPVGLDGTSASTPTAAGVFSLLNDALISAGKPAMGFLNPWIYKKAYNAFTDVTEGNTMGCNTTGYTAMTGWDPASGWGTPNFGKLMTAAGLDPTRYGVAEF